MGHHGVQNPTVTNGSVELPSSSQVVMWRLCSLLSACRHQMHGRHARDDLAADVLISNEDWLTPDCLAVGRATVSRPYNGAREAGRLIREL